MSELTDQQIFDRLGAIKGLPTCSQWAEGFADSIRDQIKRGRTLSDRQKATCNKILKENSKEALKSLANWESEYKMHHKKKAMQIARTSEPKRRQPCTKRSRQCQIWAPSRRNEDCCRRRRRQGGAKSAAASGSCRRSGPHGRCCRGGCRSS